LTFRRKEVIRNFGFGHLLLLEKCEIPSPFVRWICSCVDHVSHQIIVNDSKIISISKDSVHFVTGLPNSGSVPMPDSDGGAKFILKLFGLSEMPHITFFGNKLKSQDVLTDTEVFVCFMVIAFKCFLFPTSNELPNTDYLSILEQPEYGSSFDVCTLVFEHLIAGVYKYNKTCKLNGRKPKVFEFCYYILDVSSLLELFIYAFLSSIFLFSWMVCKYEMFFCRCIILILWILGLELLIKVFPGFLSGMVIW
jgi:hypothetical protein